MDSNTSNESVTKEVKLKIKLARKCISSGEFEKAIETCKEILELESNYMANVFMGASYAGVDNTSLAIKHYKIAIEMDQTQLLAYEGLGRLFEKTTKDLSNEVEFCKEIFQKMLKFHKDDEMKKQQVALKYLAIFKDLKNPESIYLTTSSLILASNFHSLTEDIKHGVMVQHITAIHDLDITFELESENQQLKEWCGEVMKHELSDEDTVKLAWKHYFIISNKSSDFETVWKLGREDCPQPTCHFNAERVLMMFMEAYPAYNADDMRAYKHALPQDNSVLKMFRVMSQPNDPAEAVAVISEVIEENKNLIVGYVWLALSQCKMILHEEAIKTTQTGISLMESTQAVYHLTKEDMLNQLHVSLLHCAHFHAKELKLKTQPLEATRWCSANKIFFLRALNALHHMQAFEELERETDRRLMRLQEEGIEDGVHKEVFYLHACKAVLLRHMQNQKAEEFFDKALECGDVTDYLIFFHKALLHWTQLQMTPKEDNNDIKDKFINAIIKTIQLQKLDAMPFYYLGLYFTQVTCNLIRAKDYLMKAYELDTSQREEIMLELVDCLIRLDDQELTFAYLSDILKKRANKCSKWVHLRLGAYHLKHHNHLQAIVHLQQALRTDITNHHSWERLGEAYMYKGSYISAMKAFDKALNIHESLYSLYQKAIIQQKLGELESSIEGFNKVIIATPNYLPALYGLSVSHLERAKVFVKECLLKRALCHLQEVLVIASKACEVNGTFSCVWKCLADCFSIFFHFGNDDIQLSIPDYIEKKFSINDSKPSHRKLDLLKYGERCYILALKIIKPPSSSQSPSSPSSSSLSPSSSSSLWYDLSLNILYQSKLTLLLTHTTNKEAFSKLFLKRAFQCCKKAIDISPGNFLYWNLLGVVAATQPMDDSAMAQHCFIRSLQLQNHNEVAWSNLGFLYLRNNKLQLAHQAFSMAQSVDPSFGNSWIGQALIADSSKDGVGFSEAMDLFRHSVEITNHPEAALVYAYLVCQSMQDYDKQDAFDDNTHRISASNIDNVNKNGGQKDGWLKYSFEHLSPLFSASDALVKYLELRPICHVGWNLYGLLNLRQHLYQTSCHSFQRALEVHAKTGQGLGDEILLRGNYAKALLKNEEYEKAIEILTKLPQLTFSNECLLALCHYKLGHYEQAIELYFNARDKSNNPRLLELTSVTLAAVCYCINDYPSAKEFLFESIGKDHIATKETLISLLCFGILTKEIALMKAVVAEVEKVNKQSYHSLLIPLCPNLAFPMAVAQYYLKKFPTAVKGKNTNNNDYKLKYSSIHHLNTAIRLFPNQSKPLSRLAVFFLAGVSIDDDLTTCDTVIGGVCRSAINNDDMLHFQEAMQCFILTHLNKNILSEEKNLKTTNVYSKIYSKSDGSRIYTRDKEGLETEVSSRDGVKCNNNRSDATKVNKTTIFLEAQKLVMLYPDRLENWCLLLASCQQKIAQKIQLNHQPNQSNQDDINYLTSFIDRLSKDLIDKVEKRLTVSRDDPYLRCMHQWLTRKRVLAMLLMSKDKGDVLSFLQNAMWLYEDDGSLECLKRFVDSCVNKQDPDVLIKEIKKQLEFNKEKNMNAFNYSKIALLLSLKNSNCKEEVMSQMESIRLFTQNNVLREFVEQCL